MSRALDREVAASVKSSNPQSVYNDIVAALCFPSSELLEIELLGKSHQLPDGCNLLIDGNSIAIPKVRLVQAFCYARQYFFQYQKDLRPETYQDLQNASAVMLLMDPEHLTAANLRKRLVRIYEKRSTAQLEVVLTRELLFIDSMLTSRLHRHTKSPTLWSHRRWVLEICQLNGMQRDLRRDLASVILVAAERHPRNYYAWSHLRWVIRNTGAKAQSNTKRLEPVVGPGVSPGTLLHDVKDWCIRRPGDISGWSFLLFYLLSSNIPDQPPDRHSSIEVNSAICKEVLGLATSFNWKHESVWVFLRTLVASGNVLGDERATFLEIIESKIAAQSKATETRILQSSFDWYTKYHREMQQVQES